MKDDRPILTNIVFYFRLRYHMNLIDPLCLFETILNIIRARCWILGLLWFDCIRFNLLWLIVNSCWCPRSYRVLLSVKSFHGLFSYIVYLIFPSRRLHSSELGIIDKLTLIRGALWHVLDFMIRKLILARSGESMLLLFKDVIDQGLSRSFQELSMLVLAPINIKFVSIWCW
jgi:hypothetical protein